MRLLNVMLSKSKGGLEQAAIDWHEALTGHGHGVMTVGAGGGWARQILPPGATFASLASVGGWDPVAGLRLGRLAAGFRADAVLLHGNRAMALAAQWRNPPCPRIGVAHNFRNKPSMMRMEGVIAVSAAVAAHLQDEGISATRIARVPNMIRLKPLAPRPAFRAPVVVGALGRLHRNKAFDVLVAAVALLRDRGTPVRLRLGGDGPELGDLRARITQAGAGELIELAGWVGDRAAFFASIDLLAVPSRVEPFGIVVLEGLEAGLPMVVADAEGPSEIVRDGHDALVVPREDAAALADAIAVLAADPARAARLAAAGRRTADGYALPAVGAMLAGEIARLANVADGPDTD